MKKQLKSCHIGCNNADSYNHSGFYAAYPQPNYRVLHVQPLGFLWLTRNHHHGFYMANLEPNYRVYIIAYRLFLCINPWIRHGLSIAQSVIVACGFYMANPKPYRVL